MIKYIYDTNLHPFLNVLESIYQTNKLNNLHKNYKIDLLKRENDQNTLFHKKYYDNYNKIEPIYNSFIKKIIRPIFEESIVYQKIPTFRIQLPNNVGVGEWHKDKQYNHNQSEINFFLPFTDAFDTNTIWAESEEDKGDYSPIEAKYGEVVMWEGIKLTHGNKINKTNFSRISVDFRVIPHSKWKYTGGESINTRVKFDIGEYYKLCK